MPFLAAFAVVALVEMATFFLVESQIGLGWALGIALATAVVGSILVRRAGIAVWNRIRERFRGGQLPGRELTHGAAVLVAGAFLISPGFITDVLGFLLLAPPVRDGIHRLVTRRLGARFGILRRRSPARSPAEEDVIDVEGWEQP